jgi:hypothetical protein
MRSEMEDSGISVAPIVGAAGAAVAITVVAERFVVKRHTVAIGGAAIAFAASRATSGAVRAFCEGAALASIGIAIVELVRTLRGDVGATDQHRAATEPTASDKRSASEESVTATHPPPAPLIDGEGRLREAAAGDVVTRKDLEEGLTRATRPATEMPKPTVEPLDEIGSRLSAEEHATLNELRKTAPRPIVAEVEQQLRSMMMDDAVRFPRLNILPDARVEGHAQR